MLATHERTIVLLSIVAALPAIAVALAFVWGGHIDARLGWALTAAILLGWIAFTRALHHRVVLPLQTTSNLLAALRAGDFSIRARSARPGDALGELLLEVNVLSETLATQRLGALEATALLRRVMEEIPVAVFAFDPDGGLALTNRFGEKLLGRPEARLRGSTAEELGLGACFATPPPAVLDARFPGGSGRWEARRSRFRQGGRPHDLLVLADVSRPLREEERHAWQRLIRVLGHELNNSLAPIQSIADSLERLVARNDPPPDWREDMRRGLAVIVARTASLSRFMNAYSKLARLPAPRLAPVDVGALAARVAAVETRLPVRLEPGPAVQVPGDADQLEQMLINLVRNGVDASLETGGGVSVGWRATPRDPRSCEIRVVDEGPGLPSTSNLFVPFFTTKPAGSGIGLVLSRQIAEAHGGTLSLRNRRDRSGCIARVVLPFADSRVEAATR
jgi:nitrogen fixation/metabolism regulation signal transduction histidine kinase